MNVLVVGGSGMLGSDVVLELRGRGWNVVAPTSKELDITEPESIAQIAARAFGPLDWCVNCAAYTAVDRAETEVRAATELNALGPGYLARACAAASVRLLHVSSDFVFDGEAREPYREEDPTHPLGVYGQTKRDGERAVLEGQPDSIVARTAWLFGPNGNSFPRTMIRAWEAGKSLRVVADQTGCPTYTAHLARTLADLMAKPAYPGILHCVGPEAMTWHDFARRVLSAWARQTGDDRPIQIEPIRTEDWPTPAKRPAYSVLSTERLEREGFAPMPMLDVALGEFCERLAALGV